MDLVGYDQKVFEQIKADYTKFCKEINLTPKCLSDPCFQGPIWLVRSQYGLGIKDQRF